MTRKVTLRKRRTTLIPITRSFKQRALVLPEEAHPGAKHIVMPSVIAPSVMKIGITSCNNRGNNINTDLVKKEVIVE